MDNQTKSAILATIPLTKDPLCKQVEVCEVQCEAVGVGAVKCAEDVVLVEELSLHLPLHICRLNHQILGKGY